MSHDAADKPEARPAIEITELDQAAAQPLTESEAESVEGGLLPYIEQDNLAKSAHTGGINVAMGDGSVRFVVDGVR